MQVDTSSLQINNTDTVGETSPIKKWGSLVVLSLALAIIVIDTTLLNVSLGTIIRDLNTTIQNIQWVITSYALMLAAFTITGGRLGDLFGRKRMFIVGAITFAIGSFLASISHGVGTLIMGESIIEGVGAALMMPATASLLVANFKGRDRAIAFGVWGGIAAAASAVGPILGGWLTTHYSWRWGFRINVGVVLILLLGSFLIKESRDKDHKPTLDWVGVILSALGLLSIVFGIIKAADYGWIKAKESLVLFSHTISFGWLSATPVFVALGFVILALFFAWEQYMVKKNKLPLVSLSLFKNRQFTSGSVTTAILTLGMSGLIFAIPVFLQAVKGLDALHTGLAMLPMSLAMLFAAPISAVLTKFLPAKYLIQLGLLISTVGFILLRATLGVDATVAQFIPGFIVYGIGMGMVMAQISNLTLSAVPVIEAGEASGVNNTLRQLGSTLGSAIIGAVLLSSLSTNLVSGINASIVIPDQFKTTLSQQVSKQVSGVEFGGGAHLPANIPSAISQEIIKISHDATVAANKDAIAYGIGFGFLAFLLSFWLPEPTTKDEQDSKLKLNLKFTRTLVYIVAAGLFIGVGYLLGNHNKETVKEVQVIHVPVMGTMATSTTFTAAMSTSTPPATGNEIDATATPDTHVPKPVVNAPVTENTIYQNTEFGFSLSYPSTTNIDHRLISKNTEQFYNQDTGKSYGTIEFLPNSSSQTLDSIKKLVTLGGGSNITDVTLSGKPAFTYKAGNITTAVVKNGDNLYYITGDLITFAKQGNLVLK